MNTPAKSVIFYCPNCLWQLQHEWLPGVAKYYLVYGCPHCDDPLRRYRVSTVTGEIFGFNLVEAV